MSNLIADHNEKPNILGNLSLGGSAQDLYRWTYKTEVAEMETGNLLDIARFYSELHLIIPKNHFFIAVL